ncbi:MAG: phosphate acyltransferase PlsX [Planctomycetes bacterium]|nr:phosphate acyltransferase PlsX [Planctomycetota bacterium]MBU1518467.1 phosphate acyltransferase PlsX [Planctomycetota bacterium]MBU2457567.1 phosphate acyltransferase PlsX [Planctomycetota bacterium]MBU2596666.1 phosphate acyltransferase PlsX [Planctomycetota bacterium]
MRIAIDAMGGDFAPDEIIKGALESIEKLDKGDTLILVGPVETIKAKLGAKNLSKYADVLKIVDASEVIGMDESPIDALRKKRKSSISVMVKLAADGEADAVISAGNTGACVAGCQMRMRNIEGVNRPGIAVVFPTFEGPVTMCDVGANISCKPINFYQYAIMASMYSESLLGIKNPRVGIMSIGEEEAKGNEIVKKARELIKSDPKINFIGNIEGSDIFKGKCDVAICDGFVGNVVLKLTEGLVDGLFKIIKHEVKQQSFLLAMGFKSVMMKMYQKYDYHEYGGALLLGVNGTSVICHGSSKARTISNAIMAAKKFHSMGTNEKIKEYLAKSNIRGTDE